MRMGEELPPTPVTVVQVPADSLLESHGDGRTGRCRLSPHVQLPLPRVLVADGNDSCFALPQAPRKAVRCPKHVVELPVRLLAQNLQDPNTRGGIILTAGAEQNTTRPRVITFRTPTIKMLSRGPGR